MFYQVVDSSALSFLAAKALEVKRKEEQQMEEEEEGEELLLEDEDTRAAGLKVSTMMVFLTSGKAGHAAQRGNSLWRLCGQEEGREVEEEEEQDPDEAEVVVTQQRVERCLIMASLPLVLLIPGVQDRCAHGSVARNLTMESSFVAAPYVVRTVGKAFFFFRGSL